MKSIILFIILCLAALGMATQGTAGPYKISLTSDPSVIPVGKAKLTIRLSDSAGKPVAGATVKALVQMPGMPMGEREEQATPGEPGVYTVPAVFGMAGAYDAKIDIDGPMGKASTVLTLQTGSSAEGGGGFPLGPVFGFALVVVVGWFILRQMRATGQNVDFQGIFNRQVLISVLLLGVAAAVSIWAVNRFRRPGSMTPIEAQVMAMDAPAPEGTLPVRLAQAETKPFSQTVTYSGQAVGFVEDEVVPRVTGTIVSMNVYVGDRVRKGQVLARLDTSQIDPMVSEKLAGVTGAEQGANVSSLEYQQAVNMAVQARAEASMSSADLSQAQSMLEAAQEDKTVAASDVEAALADVRGMEAASQSAIADRAYQVQNAERMKSLFASGAVSKDEWQQAEAAVGKASAGVARAEEDIRRSQAVVSASQAKLRRADAQISAAKQKVEQSQAGVLAKKAAVRTAEAAAEAAKSKISQSKAEVAAAAAGLRGATTQLGYTSLTSEVDGVVTERLISPGTVVNPGQVVLKVAQIDPIRLQANVPDSDLQRIHVGDNVQVTVGGDHGKAIAARVTSVSPSFDPSSRTGVVEALIPNSDSGILPGQYVSMRIALGQSLEETVIPSAAIQFQDSDSGRMAYAWLAEPSQNGEYVVSRRQVELAGMADSDAAVKSGVQPGDRVVVSPPVDLVEGERVTAPDEGLAMAKAQPQVIEINASGYNPPTIVIPSGKAFQLIFVRTDSQACGDKIVFPELGIQKDLPLNVRVPVDIPAQAAGKELKFTCNMHMLDGRAVAK